METRTGESLELQDRFKDLDAPLLDDVEGQQHARDPSSDSITKANERSTSFLDGLRGLAAVFVFIQHMIGGFDLNVHEHGFGQDGYYYFASLPFIRILFNGGNAAVSIFFVLSGYVLSKSPLRNIRDGKRKTCSRNLVSAVIRRPIRLYMPFLCVTFISALVMHLPFGVASKQPWAGIESKDNLPRELENWFVVTFRFLNPFQRHGSNISWYAYNLVGWTIPIELKGSILIYFLIGIYIFLSAWTKLTILILMVTAIVLLQTGTYTMACFIFGLILAFLDIYSLDTLFLAKRLSRRVQSVFWHVTFVLGYYLICEPAHAGEPAYSLNTPGWHFLTTLIPAVYNKDLYYKYWLSWGSLLLVYSILRIGWLQSFLNTRPLRFLGKVSFILYLVHLPLLGIVGDKLSRALGNAWIGIDKKENWYDNLLPIPDIGPTALNSRFLICLAIMLSISLTISNIGTRLIDAPSIKLSRMLTQKLGIDNNAANRNENENQNSRLHQGSEHPA